MNRITELETEQVGAQFSNLFDSGNGNSVSVGVSILCCCWQICLYFALAWYLDSVVPSEYGVHLPWYFPLQPLLRKTRSSTKRSETKEINTETHSDDFEKEPQGQIAVRVRSLTKRFDQTKLSCKRAPKDKKTVIAVNNVTFNIFDGECFGLLGHNGAGKS